MKMGGMSLELVVPSCHFVSMFVAAFAFVGKHVLAGQRQKHLLKKWMKKVRKQDDYFNIEHWTLLCLYLDKDTGVVFKWVRDYNLDFAKFKTKTIHKTVKVGPSMAAKKRARQQRKQANRHGAHHVRGIKAKGKTKTVTETKRVRVTPIVQGFDVLMDLSKREEYCNANNIPFNISLFANPGSKQRKAFKTTQEYFLHLEEPPEETDSSSDGSDSESEVEEEGQYNAETADA